MSLYLAVFDDGDEIAGLIVGAYSDFASFRAAVQRISADTATDFPTLLDHSDCDGQWTVEELPALRVELQSLTAVGPVSDIRTLEGLRLVEEMLELASFALEQGLPITFQ